MHVYYGTILFWSSRSTFSNRYSRTVLYTLLPHRARELTSKGSTLRLHQSSACIIQLSPCQSARIFHPLLLCILSRCNPKLQNVHIIICSPAAAIIHRYISVLSLSLSLSSPQVVPPQTSFPRPVGHENSRAAGGKRELNYSSCIIIVCSVAVNREKCACFNL